MTLSMRFPNRACRGSLSSTSNAIPTPSSSYAPCFHRCALRGRSTPVARSALGFAKAAREGWRLTDSLGQQCSTVPSSRRTTTCASPPSRSGRATTGAATVAAQANHHERTAADVKELLVTSTSQLRTSWTTSVKLTLW